MRKIIVLALTLAIVGFVSVAGYAATNTLDDSGINVIYKHPVGADLAKPTVEVRVVRYGLCHGAGKIDATLQSGDVVVWDINSDDGVTITACTVSCDAQVAGVLVGPIMTDDSNGMESSPNFNRNWGYMAVRGRVLANLEGTVTAGDKLMPSGALYAAGTRMSPDVTMVGDAADLNGAGAAYWGTLGTALQGHTASGNTKSQVAIEVQTE